jgi:hypothetical protein
MMIHIEQQVVSLGLAKKLCELGAKQESVFYWVNKVSDGEWYLATHLEDKIFQIREFSSSPWAVYGFGCECCNNYFDIDKEQIYSAFTAAEIGKLLPNGYCSGRTFWLDEDKAYACHWYRTDKEGNADATKYGIEAPFKATIYGETEADARAKMLIRIIEMES